MSYAADKRNILFYTVVRVDTLSKLTKKYLGDYERYPEIFELNKGLVNDPDKKFVIQILKIADIGKT